MDHMHVSHGLDVQKIRSDFPILGKLLPKGLPLVYLDNAATAQKPRAVIDREREVYENFYANAYRGVYRFGAMVDEQLELTRSKVQQFIGAARPDEVIFTSGSTMSINLVASAWGRKFLRAGDEVLLSVMEHHANLVPWQQVTRERGATCRYLPLTSDGRLDLNRLDEYLTRRTRLVAITGMSNVLGTINPVRQLAERAHAMGALLFVDGAQSVPHCPPHVVEEGIDFLAFSSHKIYGPSGVGVLYGRWDLLTDMDPFLTGGHMIDSVTLERSTWALPPARFEAGTVPIAQAIAMAAAIDYVQEIGLDAIQTHEKQLLEYAHRRLAEYCRFSHSWPGPSPEGGHRQFFRRGCPSGRPRSTARPPRRVRATWTSLHHAASRMARRPSDRPGQFRPVQHDG